jgi:hypothetical protein
MTHWWKRLLRRNRMEEQLEKEVRFHLDQHTADLLAQGRDPGEARREARLALGGPEQVKENCRDARGSRWLEDLWQDFRYAVRSLWKRPGFAAAALLTLALGIGAATVMFTVINGVLLKPLPYAHPDRLAAVHGHAETLTVFGLQNIAYLDFLDFERGSRSLDLAGWLYNAGTMSEPGEAEHVEEFQASSNLFEVLGVPLFRGRAFRPEEDRLVSAGMLGRTLLHLSSLDPGVNIRNVLVTRMALSPGTLADPAKIRAAWDDVLDRARHVPGVESIAMADTVPLREGNNQIGYWMTPAEPPESQQPVALATSVTPDYLKVMGIRMLQGRFFDDRDRVGSQSVVVIDDVMGRQAFGGQEPLGKQLWIGMGTDPLRVMGVVRHVRYWGLAGDDQAHVRAQLYYPFAQVPDRLLRRWSELMSITVRTGIPPLNVVASLRRAVRGATGDQVLYEVRTMEQLASGTLDQPRFLLLLFGVFAGLALLLACIGIYGVLAYLTGQRVPEMGVRMALGANAGDVMWLVLRQSLAMILGGVGVGIAAALAAGSVLERLVTGMQPTEPATFAIMVAVLVFAATCASFVPARRASRIDPVRALRQD